MNKQISVENIKYFYEDKLAIDDVSFEVRNKEKVVLLGNNGSGKSTILRILAGLYYPKIGEILLVYLFGIRKNTKKDFRKQVGILFQNPESMIFNPTVFDEISFSLKEFGFSDVEDRVYAIAKQFEIEKFLKKSPLELSGGEKQKVMLASLLVYEPQILLLDEPTAAMDPRTTGWFIDFMIDLEKTIILATHDLSLAYEMSDRALVLDEKHKKIYDGNIEELFENYELLIQANLIHKHKHKHRKKFIHSHYHMHNGIG